MRRSEDLRSRDLDRGFSLFGFHIQGSIPLLLAQCAMEFVFFPTMLSETIFTTAALFIGRLQTVQPGSRHRPPLIAKQNAVLLPQQHERF